MLPVCKKTLAFIIQSRERSRTFLCNSSSDTVITPGSLETRCGGVLLFTSVVLL